ncbi:MAG: HNH endonuclease signature motif containing protein [Pseudohongiellaceae bacterium]
MSMKKCSYQNCRTILPIPQVYCDKHKAQLAKHKSTQWRRLSKAIRAERPICEVCKTRPSQEVHHKVQSPAGDMFYDPRNLVAICRNCHFKMHR